mmetsp:Transcript_86249/g.143497  ORF Transcript_86249/g.143497 Transcript_86249/m.143497 type:complete len:242 (-) Transcript_86249:331-1056(-)
MGCARRRGDSGHASQVCARCQCTREPSPPACLVSHHRRSRTTTFVTIRGGNTYFPNPLGAPAAFSFFAGSGVFSVTAAISFFSSLVLRGTTSPVRGGEGVAADTFDPTSSSSVCPARRYSPLKFGHGLYTLMGHSEKGHGSAAIPPIILPDPSHLSQFGMQTIPDGFSASASPVVAAMAMRSLDADRDCTPRNNCRRPYATIATSPATSSSPGAWARGWVFCKGIGAATTCCASRLPAGGT